MNKYDLEYDNIQRIMKDGGNIPSPKFVIDTPTGNPSKLTYVQQLLVRTTKFKQWFGDWELASTQFLNGENRAMFNYEATKIIFEDLLGEKGSENYVMIDHFFKLIPYYHNCSKVIDFETLEPRALFHGTKSEEFFEFQTDLGKVNRPYAYFAFNKEYSENFSQGDGILYSVFLNIRNPYFDISLISRDYSSVRGAIVNNVKMDYKFKTGEELDLTRNKEIKNFLDYYDATFTGANQFRFWMVMANDTKGVFKQMLEFLGYDGVYYAEEFTLQYPTDSIIADKKNYTQAYTAFYPNEIKLADGRNTDFDGFNKDIRFEDGGALDDNIALPDLNSKYSHLKSVLKMQGYDLQPMQKFEVGGTVKTKHGETNDGKKGGYFEGRSHAEGGIKGWNVSTDSPIEVEGGEVIITKKAVEDDELKEFEGEMLTNRQILSKINQDGGGVAFEDGGEIHQCNCSGKAYRYGGETIEDYEILKRMQNGYSTKIQSRDKKAKYGHELMKRMKQGGFI